MVIGAIILACGVAVLGASLGLHGADRRFRRRALSATGEIVSLQQRIGRSEAPAASVPVHARLYYPVLSFMTQAGEQVIAKSRVGSDPPFGEVGEKLPVLYDPADPHHVRVDTPRAPAPTAVRLVAAVGAAAVVAGIVVLVS